MPWSDKYEGEREVHWWQRSKPKVSLRDVWIHLRLLRTNVTGHTAAVESLKTEMHQRFNDLEKKVGERDGGSGSGA